MGGEWRKTTIGAVCQVFDGPHATPKKVSDGPIFLNISSLSQGTLDLSKSDHISEEDFVTWTRRVTPMEGDVVFSYETRLGEAAILPAGLRCCLGRRLGLMRPNKNLVNPKYLLYAYLAPEFQGEIAARTIPGSTVDRLALTEFPNFPIRIPPLGVQQRIVDILGSLDDKIELNRAINRTLEAMAQAIFKSWFVDFDPVKAKIAARESGDDPTRAAMAFISGKNDTELDAFQQQDPKNYQRLHDTAQAFPDALVDSELGMIPEGWGVKPLSETIEILSGGTPQRSEKEYWDGDIPWFTVKDAPADGDVWVVDTEEKISAVGLAKSPAKLLPVGTTIISARGTVGKLALVGTEMAMNQSCYGILPRDGKSIYSNYFSLLGAVDQLRKNTHGAVFDTITKNTFESIYVVLPNETLLGRYEESVGSCLDGIKRNLTESARLSETRDTLLPKLLSGELPIEGGENG